ncbi:hypothetical protein P6F26_10490 [Roseibacterium sp. SDUM158017]|uniref:hypothetical protein n=1 Tax=Roseicyclus salinarum TaxID=3036773 RepID=UPI002415879B|nr:hypothetical protein [Roseibacterium sp. SDUM158017]MDG4648872.1 hypothetical protein [Roseibacterium sp. SDUM158017]
MRAQLALALLAVAAPAAAEPWHCVFTVECVASESCGESGFEARVIAADHAGELFLSAASGDSRLTRLTEADALPATYASAGADGLAELLTVEADLTALMSVHIFDGAAAAVTYFGICEELR